MYIPIPALRRPHILLLLLLSLAFLIFSFTHLNTIPYLKHHLSSTFGSTATSYTGNEDIVEGRIRRMREYCDVPSNAGGPFDEFDRAYGRSNLRLSRAYEGSHELLRRFLKKVLRGEKITVSAIGGSVTWGHGVYKDEVWLHKLGEWLDHFVGEDVEVIKVNGAAPATGSDYFSMCFPLHIPPESDLVFVELGVNDEGVPEHYENMENLIRGLLEMPNKPAVVLIEVVAFSSGGMGGGGGRIHLPVAQYYDIPVINQRHPLVAHFARHPELIYHFFARDWWGNPDTRHLNSRGHKDMAMLIASFLKDVTCLMLSEDDFDVSSPKPKPTHQEIVMGIEALTNQEELSATALAEEVDRALSLLEAGYPEQAKSWRQSPSEGEEVGALVPGIWMSPQDYGQLPRLKVLEGWNPNLAHTTPSWHPTCLSTRSPYPQFNLTPSESTGWEYWIHPDFLDKPYLYSKVPGSRFQFEVDTVVGIIKIYALRSRDFNLGIMECWLDHQRSNSVEIDGYWDSDINIGRFTTLGLTLDAGKHTVTCELTDRTNDPEGGTEFRMISLMSV